MTNTDIACCIQAGLDHPAACFAFVAIDLLGWRTSQFIQRIKGKSVRQFFNILAREFARSRGLTVRSAEEKFAPLMETIEDPSIRASKWMDEIAARERQESLLDSGELVIEVHLPSTDRETLIEQWVCLMRVAILSLQDRTAFRDEFNMLVAPYLPDIEVAIRGCRFRDPSEDIHDILQLALVDAWSVFCTTGRLHKELLERLARNASHRVRHRVRRRRRKIVPHRSADWAFPEESLAEAEAERMAKTVFFEDRMIHAERAVRILRWRVMRESDREAWEILATIAIKLLGVTQGHVYEQWKFKTLTAMLRHVSRELRGKGVLPKEEIHALLKELRRRLDEPDIARPFRRVGSRRLRDCIPHCPHRDGPHRVGEHVKYAYYQAKAQMRERYWLLFMRWRLDP